MSRPLCWSCKHGLCVKLKRGEVLEADLVEEQGEAWKEEEPKSVLKTEVVKHEYLTYCHWVPDGRRAEPADGYPAEMFDVEQCSQHEEKSSGT